MSEHPLDTMRSLLIRTRYCEERIERVLAQAKKIWDDIGDDTAIQDICGEKTDVPVTPPPPGTYTPKLWKVTGVTEPKPINLSPGRYMIGRYARSHIWLHNPSVSFFHCGLIVHTTESVEIRDLASSNGTLINDVPIGSESAVVHSGDTIRLGQVVLIFTAGK